jgi:AmiR/NasT family two-component response regulator
LGQSYHIAIADSDPEPRDQLRDTLIRAGHEVVVEAYTGEELVQLCNSGGGKSLQLIITDVQLADMTGVVAAETVLDSKEVPFIIVTDCDNEELIEYASAHHAFAFLTKPVRELDLNAEIQIVMQRFAELQAFRADAKNMRQALEDRKIIERAKGIIMLQRSLDEASAFTFLQRLAREHRQKLVDVARSIILGDQGPEGAMNS